ncbi:hypothetical protein [uncultured Bradyrhizobium sp.]|jgi:pimeloyl-ACP methyl ester carboxylesterase|uniref:lipase/acyltransferase domain-containing protein n=1 Tax=uncultured Bradyrhizobium sp. TaxID=199684 RepID=UPI00260BEB75|nr:hypothetical protein [uncultured Bradyrhizobium sp.]
MLPARLIAAFCILMTAATASRGQTILPKSLSQRAPEQSIAQSELDKYYEERHAAQRKNTPRIIFVPGILGSTIDECRPDGSQCVNIWGTVGALKRDVDLSVKSDRTYRTDVVESIFFRNIYGGVLDYIRAKADALASDRADDPLVTVLHYDWRLSNGYNATLLRDRVCAIRSHAESSPIVIIAHSMGGLLTKVWASRYARERCADGKAPDVAQIIFVATPHLGSPKAIKALAEGYNIIFDELGGAKRYLGLWERNYVLASVNQAGMGFPSIYELLPIRSSEYCSSRKPALAKAAVPVVGDNEKPVSLFDIDAWRRYDLLRRIGAPAVRRSYYEHDLAPLLKQSEQLLCEIVDFDPSSIADVKYFFGREKSDRTFGWFHLRSGGAGDSIDKATLMQGDGTVPVYSAQNLLVSSTRQITEIEADHTSIVSSEVVRQTIDDIYEQAMRRAELEPAKANPKYAALLTDEAAATGNLLSVSLDPAAWSKDDEKLAIELNRNILDKMGYKAADVAKLASLTPEAPERAKLYAVAATTANEPSQRLAWTVEIARSSYETGRFLDSIGSSNYVARFATKELPANDPATESLVKTAEELEGWAYLKDGQLEKFNERASSYAAKYAVSKDAFKEPASSWSTAVGTYKGLGSGSVVYDQAVGGQMKVIMSDPAGSGFSTTGGFLNRK